MANICSDSPTLTHSPREMIRLRDRISSPRGFFFQQEWTSSRKERSKTCGILLTNKDGAQREARKSSCIREPQIFPDQSPPDTPLPYLKGTLWNSWTSQPPVALHSMESIALQSWAASHHSYGMVSLLSQRRAGGLGNKLSKLLLVSR